MLSDYIIIKLCDVPEKRKVVNVDVDFHYRESMTGFILHKSLYCLLFGLGGA